MSTTPNTQEQSHARGSDANGSTPAARQRDPRNERKRLAKKEGSLAARDWLRSATIADQIRFAGAAFTYGEVLDVYRDDTPALPNSLDVDYSWGFWKVVKSRVYHAVYAARRLRALGIETGDDDGKGEGQR